MTADRWAVGSWRCSVDRRRGRSRAGSRRGRRSTHPGLLYLCQAQCVCVLGVCWLWRGRAPGSSSVSESQGLFVMEYRSDRHPVVTQTRSWLYILVAIPVPYRGYFCFAICCLTFCCSVKEMYVRSLISGGSLVIGVRRFTSLSACSPSVSCLPGSSATVCDRRGRWSARF